MKNIFLLLTFLFTFAHADNIKISQLPLGTATSTNANDVFPYVTTPTLVTKKMTLWDLANIPSIVHNYAPLANPTFTGVVTAPSFVGSLTGTASGNTSYTPNQHGVVVSGSGNVMSVVSPGTTNYALLSNGASLDPSWGIVPIAGGGTGQSSLGTLSTTTSGITIVGGTNALISSATVNIATASTFLKGLLTSTDWNTFNGKANANLSNLSSTAVSVDITPANQFVQNLGSDSLPFKQLKAGNITTPQVVYSYTGNTTSGSFQITNLSSTVGLAPDSVFQVTGTGISAAATSIITIDSPTQITVDRAATANGTGVTLTFISGQVNHTADSTTTNSGQAIFRSGSSSGAATGQARVTTGVVTAGSSATGGTTVITGNNLGTGASGGVILGTGTVAGSAIGSGSATITTGTLTSSSASGAILSTTGDNAGSGASGAGSFLTGISASALSGNILVKSGTGSTGSGSVTVASGNATGASSVTGVTVFGSGNSATGGSGVTTVTSGNVTAGANGSGSVFIASGTTVSGNSGNVTVSPGASSGGIQGVLFLGGSSINATSKQIKLLAEPTASQDATTKNYVDNAVGVTKIAPKVTIYTTGSGTHSITGTPLYVTVDAVGGGGGGAGGGGAGVTDGTVGGNTTFGTSLITANGGGQGLVTGAGGTGGSSTLGAGATGLAIAGSDGGTGTQLVTATGGHGGTSCIGGAGRGGQGNGGAGVTAKTNSGSGGGGAAGTTTTISSGAGASGGCIRATITTVGSSYSYSIGSAGPGGNAGTGGGVGGDGAKGIIVVTEYYQ